MSALTPTQHEALRRTEESEALRRTEERAKRQTNPQGQTTMQSPLGRLLVSSLRTTTPNETINAKKYMTTLLSSNDGFLVVGKSTCPRCVQAVELLSTLGHSLQVVMLDELIPPKHVPPVPSNNSPATTIQAIQDYLWDLTGARTVPRIFFNQIILGGYDDVLERHTNDTLFSFIHQASGNDAGNDAETKTAGKGPSKTKKKSPKIKQATQVTRVNDAGNDAETKTAGKGPSRTKKKSPKIKQATQVTRVNQVTQVTVAYKGTQQTCYLLPSLTGLQMKSYIMNEFNLQGGFGGYYLQCQGVPFGSRTKIGLHDHFGEQCHLTLEDIGNRPKAIGYT